MKFKGVFLAVILTTAFCANTNLLAYSGGDGSAENPYQISSVANWQQLMNTSGDWAKAFILVADVNLAKVTLTPVGNSTTVFSGSFDGNGHVIRNAAMDYSNNNKVYFVGLFGLLQLGQIKNLGVLNANIQGVNNVGVLVGQSYQSTITNCYSTGYTWATSNFVGGLVGYNMGTITSCYSAASAQSYTYAGGLVGQNNGGNGKIINCYATGWTSAVSCSAGLVGINANGIITDCYATGSVLGNNYLAGLVGNNNGTITSSFWDTQTTGQTLAVGLGSATGATGKSTADMKTLSTFTSAPALWDFTNETANGTGDYWYMPANSYPRLAWLIRGDIAGSYGVNFVDYAKLAAHWGQTGCPTDCENTDINNDGTVDIKDLKFVADNWLTGI